METPIRLPVLGSGQSDLSVSCWLIDTGDEVAAGDRVVELLTAGMTFDVSAPICGRLTRIEKPFDSPVAVGDILGWSDPETPDE